MIDEELYQLATDELNSNKRRSDIWARACALASDDHDEARYLYTNLRVEQLLVERENPQAARAGSADSDHPPAIDAAYDDTDGILSENSTGADDASANDITTHDFQSDDLTPDDFAAATIDMSFIDDEEEDAEAHVKAAGESLTTDQADGPAGTHRDDTLAFGAVTPTPEPVLPPTEPDTEEPPTPAPDVQQPGPGAPDSEPQEAEVHADGDKAGGSYWDDDDFTFELEPLESPAAPSDDASGTAGDADTADADTALDIDTHDETGSTRSGIDGEATARLTESDLADFSADSLLHDVDSADAEHDGSSSTAANADLTTDPDPRADPVADHDGHADDLDSTGESGTPVAGHTSQSEPVSTDHFEHDQSRHASAVPIDAAFDTSAHTRATARLSEQKNEAGGRSWLVYRRDSDELRAVKQGACWPALFLTLPWLLSRQLFGTALVYVVLWIVLAAGLMVSGLAWLDAGTAAPLLTKLVFAGFALLGVTGLLYLPFQHANTWHARKLERRGFSVLRQLNARNARAAVEHAQASA